MATRVYDPGVNLHFCTVPVPGQTGACCGLVRLDGDTWRCDRCGHEELTERAAVLESIKRTRAELARRRGAAEDTTLIDHHPGGAELIAGERARQVAVEGWTSAHDDEHGEGELVRAAHCYLAAAIWAQAGTVLPQPMPAWARRLSGQWPWPWDEDSWKPDVDAVRNLEKAGALIAAEMDRLLRSEPDTTNTHPTPSEAPPT